MRITGFFEDDEGNGRYLVEWRETDGRKRAVLFSEAGRTVECLSAEDVRSLFEKGDLEACSFPASDVLFPDEIKELAECVEQSAEEENH